jgi:D-glycero-alpha-D-manno-heptose 1-phosphate guanylyltransferase
MDRLEGVTAAILAGGLGTRLRPVIADRPKVLAPVAGRPFLSHLLDQLHNAGIGETVLLLGYEAEKVRAEFGTRFHDMRLSYSIEPELLGTGGAVRNAIPLLHQETLLLMNGDSYCDLDLPAFVGCHRESRTRISLTLTHVEDVSRFGRVSLSEGDRILRFEEKQALAGPGWINAGIYLLDRKLFESVAQDKPMSLERDLLPNWILSEGAYGFRGCRFIDIGVPESYDLSDEFFSSLQGKGQAGVALT